MNLNLETDRLVLRPLTELDIAAYEKHFVDYEVIRHLSSKVPWPYPENGVCDWVHGHILPKQGNNRWFWGVYLKSNTDEMIGGVELWRPGTPENRGFWLGRAHWGQGYMTEAVVAVMDCAFDQLGFDSLVFTNARGNSRSARVKEKTGAKLIRTIPGQFVDPCYTESEVWELHKQDWKQHKEGNFSTDMSTNSLTNPSTKTNE